MPLDYSRFNGIGDSDSEGSQGGLDLSKLLNAAGGQDSPPDSPRQESPRAALQRSLVGASAAPPAQDATSSGQADASRQEPEPVTLERFAELAEGAEAVHGDDPMELLAVAQATTQSALADGQGEAPCRLVRALAVGLAAEPKPIAFAREQAPELVADILTASASGLVPSSDCEQVLSLMGEKCKPRELYTFLIEALCSSDLAASARVRGIRLLQVTFLRMDEAKRHLFLASCLPVLLKNAFQTKVPEDALVSEMDAMRDFATEMLPKSSTSGGSDVGPGKVAESMVMAFLLKATLKALPAAIAVEGLGLAAEKVHGGGGGSEPDSKRPRSVGSPLADQVIELRCSPLAGVLPSLSAMAKAGIAASSKPLVALLEEVEIGDPTTDGGGDIEVSPLCLAAVVCLLELHGCWRDLQPQVLPIGLSAARRVNILMRSCFILISNGDVAPSIVSMGEANAAGSGPGSVAKGPCWAHRGLALFAASVAPLVRLAVVQTPQAYASPSGPLCRWYPARVLRVLLESLGSTPDIDREVRGALFRKISDVFRAFAWPCRFDLYLNIINACKVDSIISAVVTLFKDDWWGRACSIAEAGESLGEERSRLIKVFKATLSGDLQIVDGMDTITAALNLARLVVLTQLAPVGPFMREAMRKGGPGVDLDGMLAGVSRQIDVELGLLDKETSGDGNPSGMLASAMEEALGKSEGSLNFKEMKRDRITMVAHLVARVREVLASAAT